MHVGLFLVNKVPRFITHKNNINLVLQVYHIKKVIFSDLYNILL